MEAGQFDARHITAGFSLIEILVVLTLLGIFAALGAPSLSNAVDRQRLRTASADLISSIRLAREEAISRNQNVVMRPASNDWNGGWQVFVDADNSGLLDAGDTLLLEERTARLNGISATGQLTRYIRYNAFGESEQLDGGFLAGTLRLCPQDLQQPGQQLIINRVGRLRSESAYLPASACVPAER